MSKSSKTSAGTGKAARPAKPRRANVNPLPAEAVEQSVASDDSESRLDLGPDLRIAHAADCFERLGMQPTDLPLALHAESVAKVDAAGLQAVLAGLLARRSAGGRWHWHNPSGVLTHSAELLGLKGALELP